MTAERFESKWQNMPDRSHHEEGIDRGLEKDIGEGQLRAEAEAEAGLGATRDLGETAEAKAALRDPDLALRVVQGSEAKRKEDTAEVKAALDPNPEKNQEKAGPSLNQNPGLKRTTPVLRQRVEASQEKTVVQSPNPDREVTD